MKASVESIVGAVATIAVYTFARGNRRPSRRAYQEACALVQRNRALALEAVEITLNARGRRAVEAVLRASQALASALPRVARALAHHAGVLVRRPVSRAYAFPGGVRMAA